MLINFVVPGEPCGKARPRFVRATGRTYNTEKTVNAETLIKELFAHAYPNFVPLDCALQAIVIAYMGIPASASGKAKVAMLKQEVWPTKKPDGDNIIKLVADSLNKLAFTDDKNIVDWTIKKVYSDRPRLEINIIPKEV